MWSRICGNNECDFNRFFGILATSPLAEMISLYIIIIDKRNKKTNIEAFEITCHEIFAYLICFTHIK